MCGIAGIVGPEGATIAPERVHAMCQAIVHRGPDDEGIYAHGHVGLGMRRLSIIDVQGGQQPVHNEDRSIWLVFNGEIYNFLELREELERAGHRFYTHSDTETIVHLYEQYGADAVSKLRGMFAIALYDARHRRLLLARDRLGKKPLHFALRDGFLYFGSEIKALLAVAPELAEVNRAALLEYFHWGYIPDPLTAFTPIQKLPPAHLLEYEAGRIKIRRYWDVGRYGVAKFASEGECLDELERHLQKAVAMRLISEVPLGGLLSGGVDSSVVVALMARASSRPVQTFSIGFEHQAFDEAPYARAVAAKFATEHHEMVVHADFGETLDLLTRMMEEPFADSSLIPTYHVCRMARQQVTVALAGDGGDEIFGGYDRYRIFANWARYARAGRLTGDFYRRHVYPRLPLGFPGRRFCYNVTLPPAERYLDLVALVDARARDPELFSVEWQELARANASPVGALFDSAPAADDLSRAMYTDIHSYLPGDILTKVDRMSMANSLEVRAPLLDHVVVEWATSVPWSWHFRGGEQKYLLKQLARRLGVPAEVLDRPKQGFAIPLVHWLRNELRSTLMETLLEPRTLQRGYFNAKAVRTLVNEHLTRRRDRSAPLWALLVFELWHRNFLERRESTSRDAAMPVPAQPAGAGTANRAL